MRKGLSIGASRCSNGNVTVAPLDAQRVATALRTNGDGSSNIEFAVETDEAHRLSKELVSDRVEGLFSAPATLAVFYYSGHGQRDGDGCSLLLETISGSFQISIAELISQANESAIRDAVLIFDCCHSGINANWMTLNLRPGVSVFAACSLHEKAWTNDRSSIFTELLLDGLHGAAADSAGEITTSGLYTFIERPLGAWDQRPMFAANLFSTQILRRCADLRTINAIRLMPKLFRASDSIYRLDAAHLRTDLKADLDKVHAFTDLEILFKEGFIDVEDDRSLSEAAFRDGKCSLSRKGAAYWRLAKDGRI